MDWGDGSANNTSALQAEGAELNSQRPHQNSQAWWQTHLSFGKSEDMGIFGVDWPVSLAYMASSRSVMNDVSVNKVTVA